MSSIRILPPEVAAQLKSSVNITSLNDAVLGLIKNSLDADASRINIEVDFGRGSCIVEDDGEGIATFEFGDEGGLCLPFHTSKHGSSGAQYGFYGTFLASLGGISVLNILSRKMREAETSQVVIYQAQRLSTSDSRASHHQLRSRRHGTRVTVQDLFGTMPVRVKQRPLGDENQINRERAWKKLCSECLGLLLAHESDVTLTIKGSEKHHSLRLQPKPLEHLLMSIDAGFNAARCCNLLLQSPATDNAPWSTWVQTAARGDDLVIRGLVSKRAAPSKDIQFISLGIYPLSKDGPYGDLYEAVNNVFASSSFTLKSVSEVISKEKHVATKMVSDIEKTDPVYRHPMYYVRIDQQSTELTRPSRPSSLRSKDVNQFADILEAMMIGFLKNQGHKARKRSRRPASSKPSSPAASPPGGADADYKQNVFAGWSRMKQGANRRSFKGYAGGHLPDADRNAAEAVSAFDETEAIALCQGLEPITASSREQLIPWADPKDGESLRVNKRTGMVEELPKIEQQSSSQQQQVLSRRSKRLTIGPGRSDSFNDGTQAWVNQLADGWQNPVFGMSEEPIPTAATSDKDLEALARLQHFGDCRGKALADAFKEQAGTIESRITREDLYNARVISQVDSKFILAVTRSISNPNTSKLNQEPVVFIIDQHAADERIRVETLLQQLCQTATHDHQPFQDHPHFSGVVTLRLAEPLSFAMSAREHELFEQDAAFFASWGILYVVHGASEEEKACSTRRQKPSARLVVLTLPSVIAERCRVDPKLLRELLFKEIWGRNERGLSRPLPERSGSKADGYSNGSLDRGDWLQRIHDCPKGLLEMINSRSCRSAIMFNDKLTLVECQSLVNKLADCTFPFQCAHGRPSMLPLTKIDAWRSEFREEEMDSFVSDYREWRKTG